MEYTQLAVENINSNITPEIYSTSLFIIYKNSEMCGSPDIHINS